METRRFEEYAAHCFKDHVPTIFQADTLEIIDWRNPESSEYSIRFIFDNYGKTLSITGDLGDAILELPSFDVVNLREVGKIKDYGYLASKISCSTDLYKYDYDLAREDIVEHLIAYTGKKVRFDDELMESFFDEYNGFTLSNEIEEELAWIDPDYEKWFYNAGKILCNRVLLWFRALNLIWNSLYSKK